MTPLSGLQQPLKAEEPATGPPEAKVLPWLACLKMIPAGGDLIGAERCDTAPPTLENAGRSACF
jgi:hypothetical protein